MTKKLSVILLVLLSLLLAVPACSRASELDVKDLTDLVPSGANLIISGHPDSMLSDPDLTSLSEDMGKDLGGDAVPETDVDSLKQQALDKLGLDIQSLSEVLLFMDTSTTSQDMPYLGLIGRGSFDETKILAAVEESAGKAPVSSTYNGQTLYSIDSDTPEFAFLSSSIAVLASDEALRDIIDVNKGTKPRLSGDILESYKSLGDPLLRGAATIPPSAMDSLGTDPGESPISLDFLQALTLTAFSYDKSGETNTLKIVLVYPNADGAAEAGSTLNGLVTMLKGYGMMAEGPFKSLAGIADKVSISTSGARTTITLSVTTSEIEALKDSFAQADM